MAEKWMRCKAIFFIIFGVLAAILQLTATVLEAIEDGESEFAKEEFPDE